MWDKCNIISNTLVIPNRDIFTITYHPPASSFDNKYRITYASPYKARLMSQSRLIEIASWIVYCLVQSSYQRIRIISLQPYLPNITRLQVGRFLTLIPPSFLCIGSLSEESQLIHLCWPPEWPLMTCCHYVIFMYILSYYGVTRQLKQQEKQEKARKLKKRLSHKNVSRWLKNVTRCYKSERMFLEKRRTCHVGQNVTRFVKP